MSENLSKLLHLQGLLKKEHRKCVEMFEKYALVSSYLEANSFDVISEWFFASDLDSRTVTASCNI